MVAGADRDAVEVQDLRYVVRMDPLDVEGHDPRAPLRRRPVQRHSWNLAELPWVKTYGPPADRRAGIISFNVDGIHPHDVAQILDGEGVAIRAGHHCCQPLMAKLGVAATNRASFYLYTVTDEIDRLVAGLHKVRKILA